MMLINRSSSLLKLISPDRACVALIMLGTSSAPVELVLDVMVIDRPVSAPPSILERAARPG